MSESGQLDVSRYSLGDPQNRRMTVRNCLVTGASGFIGRVLLSFYRVGAVRCGPCCAARPKVCSITLMA